MKIIFLLTLSLFVTHAAIADEFTIATYNCGGLSNHYDYLRGIAMQKLMQERYIAEPANMALNEKIQQVALKILFSSNPDEKAAAEQEWNKKGYQKLFEHLTAVPSAESSPNALWNQKADQIITSYKKRPIVIHDTEVYLMLIDHMNDLTQERKVSFDTRLGEVREIMGKRIFDHHLKFDIICLQEADYLDYSFFPEQYDVYINQNRSESMNGVMWNKERFELIQNFGSTLERTFIVKLQDKQNGKTVLVVSGHLSGCNPYKVENNDSAKGDNELKAIVQLLDENEADIKVIGMDSNVTSLHPRLNILKESDFKIDCENFLECTCTNPYQVLNTRIDWIAVKEGASQAAIVNIPVLGVGLNCMQTNISDHKPIAAKINY
jgi:hypothetical protein